MKLNPKFGIKLFTVLMLSIFLQACTSNSEKSPSKGETKSGSGGTLTVAMSAGNLPVPDIVPTEGAEGRRFVGYQIYDGLVRWDLTSADKTSVPIPGLAESWDISADKITWTFHLRKNVKFHDGTPWNADAAIFGLDEVVKKDFEFYNSAAAASISANLKWIDSYRKIDDYTIEIKMKEPFSLFHWDLNWLLFASPEAVKKYGKDYINHPVGTGPFKFVSMVPGQKMVLEPNKEYWGKVPKLDRLILRPMPESSARLAALQTGEVNWAEVPPPESMELLKKQGFQVLLNAYPHIWPLTLNLQIKPWDNKLVRQAANYAIDREGLANSLLGGAARPAKQLMYPGNAWYSEGSIEYTYNPEKAKKLLAEAGYANGFETTFVVPSSGSGNMWPLPMIEFVQQNLAAVGIKVKVEVMEWATMNPAFRAGFPKDKQIGAVMISLGTYAPMHAIDRNFSKTSFPPIGNNKGMYSNPQVDELINQIKVADPDAMIPLMKKATAIITEDAPWIFVVHDLNLRVLAPNVKGLVMAQNWFVDLDTVWVK
jgi:peptide/nickel transport system substrate-binding protein